MQQEIIDYMQNLLRTNDNRMVEMTKDPTGKYYPTRTIFVKIKKYYIDFIRKNNETRWLIVPGLRGVGKTTLLAQTYVGVRNWYHAEYKTVPRILFLPVDYIVNVKNSNIKEALDCYEYLLGENFEALSSPVFIFLDEVQSDSEWGSILKTLFDRSKKIFIFCTGSSALALQESPDVARRSIFEKLYPCSLAEYLVITEKIYPPSGLKSELRQALWYSDSAKSVFEQLSLLKQKIDKYWSSVGTSSVKRYLIRGTLPFAMNLDEIKVYEGVFRLVEKIISNDVAESGSFKKETLDLGLRLISLLADAGDHISLNKLADTLSLNVKTVMEFISVLEKTELLIKINPYGSMGTKVRKPSKYLFMSPTIRAAFLYFSGGSPLVNNKMGNILEDAVGLYLYKDLIQRGIAEVSYDSSKASADFIVKTSRNLKIPVEVGLGKKDCNQVISSMKKVGGNYGIVISTGELNLNEKENIIKIPLEFFLLS